MNQRSSRHSSASTSVAVLAELPERYLGVLKLRFIHGDSVHEAAQQESVTPGNLKISRHPR